MIHSLIFYQLLFCSKTGGFFRKIFNIGQEGLGTPGNVYYPCRFLDFQLMGKSCINICPGCTLVKGSIPFQIHFNTIQMKYSLVEVNDKKTRKEFLHFPVRLYKNEKNYIRPLDQDVEKVFDPKINKSFRNGECIRWLLLLSENGETVGRVSAFIDRKVARNNEQPTGSNGIF
jgi:hypothetical protein